MKIYHRMGKKAILDSCRDILVPANPEEIVRQNLIQTLIREMKVPPHMIDTEYHMARVAQGQKTRADIIVWADDPEEDMQVALMVIEVKAGKMALTDRVYEQALEYQRLLGCDFVGIANGDCLNNIQMFHIQEDGSSLEMKHGFTYEDLINKVGLEYYPSDPAVVRRDYEDIIHESYLKSFVENEGNIYKK